VTIGPRGSLIAEEAERAGVTGEAVHRYQQSQEVIDYLRRTVRPGDTVLVKGSRALGLEEIVQAITES
jgi:UDP-N-acetylmuramoyl-tripeptide--D-alanyl-D-alanine ligase